MTQTPTRTVVAGVEGDASDGVAASATKAMRTAAEAFVYNGATWDRKRSPNIFKTVTATASGDTAVWTPASGKKFRLVGFFLMLTNEAAISGGGADLDIVLRDGTTAMGIGMSLYVPQVTGTTVPGASGISPPLLGNGILSATANNVLNINLSATLTSGKIRITAFGTEE